MRLRFILPLPPSVNHQYTLRNGIVTLSGDAQAYKRSLTKALAGLKASGKLSTITTSGQNRFDADQLALRDACKRSRPISMRYEFFLRSLNRRDLDNGVKLVQDAICEALGIDDRDVVEIYMAKRIDRDNPRLIVTMTTLDYWDNEGEFSLFRQPEEADAEFNLLTLVKRATTKPPEGKRTALSTLQELIERFNWGES